MRLISPILVAPWCYSCFSFKEKINVNSQRTLILISKVITNLSNQQTFANSKKEQCMIGLDSFITENLKTCENFLLEVADIPDNTNSENHNFTSIFLLFNRNLLN